MARTPSADEYLPLLRTQQNEAFGWVERAGFDPRAFNVGPGLWGKSPCTRFAYKNSPYFFDVGTARRSFHVRYSPGDGELLTHQMTLGWAWDRVEDSFDEWLENLRREVESPDLWAMGQAGPTLFFVGETIDDNAPFTPRELAEITAAVERARVYLIESGVEKEALADANEKLDYLVEASRRSGRFDWANIAFSTAWAIIVSTAFDPDRARALFEMLARPVRQLLGG